MKKKEPVILKLGGSIIYPPEGADIEFLRKFNKFIRKYVKKGKRFFIICGGGNISRDYQQAVRDSNGKVGDKDLDWLGIYSTRINGHLLWTIFKDLAFKRLIRNYDQLPKTIKKPVVITAGWKPGWSTDYDTVLLAQKYEAKELVNLSNIKMVYDKDPNKFPHAKPIKKISWDNYLKLVGEEWSPGLNAPFDPVASKMAKKIGLKVIICHGHDFKNLDNILQEKEFVGTVIE